MVMSPDSFSGRGTTAAALGKRTRRWGLVLLHRIDAAPYRPGRKMDALSDLDDETDHYPGEQGWIGSGRFAVHPRTSQVLGREEQ